MPTISKKELVSAVAERGDITKIGAESLITTLCHVIVENLQQGNEVVLPGIGKFSVADRAARTARNPQTGEEVQVAAKKAPKFGAAKALKDAIAG